MTKQTLSFSRTDSAKFFRTLNKRVNDYFKDNNIKRTGNWKLWVKTIVMFSLFLTPYFLLLTLSIPGWAQLLLTIVMGIGMAGIGLSIMHDANHGAYSKNQTVNKVVGYIITLVGGNDVNWRIQHNVLHHTYTNVTGMDEDLSPGSTLRFSPHEPRRTAHK